MRHTCLFISVSLALLSLSGCRLETGGSDESSAFNPASNVDLTFSTFDLTDTDQAPDTLSHTRFSDFYTGIEPLDSEAPDARHLATVTDVRRHIDRFIGAQPTEDGKAYTRVRNPLDLMNQAISVGRIDNFDEGRRYIRERIAIGAAGTYNSRSAGARIRFTDQTALLGQRPLNDSEWNYQTLDWRYQPPAENLTGKVYRVIQYVARDVGDADREQQPQLLSLLSGSRYNANEFSNTGYNQPEYATADYVSRDYGGIELRQEFAGDAQKDTLFIKSTERKIIGLDRYGETITSPDCLRIELNYSMDEVRIYTSHGEPARTGDDQKNNANCANQDEASAIAFWPVAYSERRKF